MHGIQGGNIMCKYMEFREEIKYLDTWYMEFRMQIECVNTWNSV